MNPKDFSKYLRDHHDIKVEPQTLAKWRHFGKGPRFRKKGPWVDYTREAGDEYALSVTTAEVQSTSELPPRRSNCQDARATASAEPGTESSAPPNHHDAGARAA